MSCVRDAEGGGEQSEPPALPRFRLRKLLRALFLRRAKQSTSLRWAKPEAISYWIVGIPFEIASLTAFIRNDGCFTLFVMTLRRGLPKR